MAGAKTNPHKDPGEDPAELEERKKQRRERASKRRAALAERRRDALELRKSGATYYAISRQLGVSETQARNDVAQAIKGITEEPARDVLKLETERLDRLFTIAYRQALAGDLTAIDRAIKIMDRRARFLGLDQMEPLNTDDGVTKALTGFLTQIQNAAPKYEDSPPETP